MSDFDKVRLGDWVRIRQNFAKEGPIHAYSMTLEGVVTDRDERAKLLRIIDNGQTIRAITSSANPNITVELLGHRPVREIGWHEVYVPVSPTVAGERVLWWDGQEWRWGPGARTGAVHVINNDSTYLGRGSR